MNLNAGGATRPASYFISVFVYCFAVAAAIQFAGPQIVGTDGYYHIKVADLMRNQGWVLDFPWLKFTILDRENYTDHHWLLHLFQLPFTALFSDLRLAAKWSAVVMAASAFSVFAWTLARYRVRAPIIWVFVLFAASSPFLYRMSMARGQALSVLIQLLAFHLLIQRRHYWLAILSAVFVLAYNGFAILAPLLLIGLIIHYVVDRKIEFNLGVAVAGGLAIGLLIHPYFPRDIYFLWNHIVPKIFAADYAGSIGKEWHPYSSWKLLTSSWIAIAAYVLAMFLTSWSDLKRDKERFFWLLTATLYFFLFVKSRRFAEYFPFAAVMFLALSSRNLFTKWSWKTIRLDRRLQGLSAAIFLALAIGFWQTIDSVREDISESPPAEAYGGAARWLSENTPPDSIIFHSDWDDFPKLFFFNTNNRYLVGLDPDFMRLKNANWYRRWRNVTKGRDKNIEQALRVFNARYIFTDKKHKKFIRLCKRHPRLDKVYEDPYALVYLWRDTKPDQ